MEVTRSNFQEALPKIEAAINAADFMSVDGEFSGLSSGSSTNAFDTPAECYRLMRDSSQEFLLIQFGLTTFRWDAESNKYKHCSFNFYIFPRREYRTAPDKVFSCQSTSIEFLTCHKFDFNKLFYEGISYIDTTEETKLRDYTSEKHKSDKLVKNTENDSFSKRHIDIPDVHKPQLENICKEVEELISKGEKKSIEFKNLNSFIRKLVYQELEAKFEDSIQIETKPVDMRTSVLVVSYGFTDKDRADMLLMEHKKELEKIDRIVGFSTVVRLISDSRKLVVGHNVCLDLLHLVNNFFYPLPFRYKEFKSLTTHVFESVLDTNFIARTVPFKNIIGSFDLKSMHGILSSSPFKLPPCEVEDDEKLMGYTSENEEYHNAGYDSYITGCCLLSMFEYLSRSENLADNILDKATVEFIPYFNRLYLHRTALQGSPCINLKGADPNPPRDHVFHIEFPKAWKRGDIYGVFEIYGGLNMIEFINGTSAYVALKNSEKSSDVISTLCKQQESYTVTPFWESKRLFSIQNSKGMMEKVLKSTPSDDVEIKDNSKTYGGSNALNTIQSFLKRKFKDEDIGEPISKQDVDSNQAGSSKNKSGEQGRRSKKRRLSHTTSGDFIVCDDAEAKEQLDTIAETFKESDNWD